MEGLEAIEVKLAHACSSTSGARWDSEFYRKSILRAESLIRSKSFEVLAELAPRIQHPIEVERIYSDDGLRILLAQEVRSNSLALTAGHYMPYSMETTLNKNKLQKQDVVLTRSGANFGQCAPVLNDESLFACADLLIIRKGRLHGAYLSTFLSTTHGRLLLDRGAYGMAQPHIAPTYVSQIPVPRFPKLEKAVASVVETAVERKGEAIHLQQSATRSLVSCLCLPNRSELDELTYCKQLSQVISSSRLDAEFFHPRVDELYDKLGNRALTVSDVTTLRQERFIPGTSKFDYLEIGAVSTDGTVQDSIIDGVDAPSRATWIVHKNDIVTSTVRPIRSLTAMIDEHQENAVASSGFAVLQPTHISPELLLCYLKLPQICELMDLHTSASMYPAISVSDILNLPFKHPGKDAEDEIISLVQQARAKRRQSKSLLERAKRAVEIAIEHDEATALAYLDGKHYVAEELLPKLFHLNRHYVDLDAIQRTIEAESIHYEPTTISRYLLDWQAESRLFDAGRGWYSDLPHRYVHSADIDIVNSVLDVIQENFPMLEHSIWSTRELTKFFHHLPTRHATFLMVDRDAFESVAEVLQDTGLNVIVHPLGEVAKKFKLIVADTVIIRPRLASDHHEIRSPIEQVLVDLHYECQKLGLYDGQEVSRIVNNLGTAYRINIAALSRYAQRRKIDPQDILSSIL